MIESLSFFVVDPKLNDTKGIVQFGQKINEIIDAVNRLEEVLLPPPLKIREPAPSLLADNRRCDKCYYERERSVCLKCSGYDHYLLKIGFSGV